MLIPHSKPTFVKPILAEVNNAIINNEHFIGNIRSRFEEGLSDFIGLKYSYAVNSGSSALHLVMMGLGVKEDSLVIIPSYTCAAVLNAVKYVGATPIIADVDSNSFNLTSGNVRRVLEREKLVEKDIACAIVTHSFGFPAPVNDWNLKIPLIEDCCTGLGSYVGKNHSGTYGKACVLSFYATKMLSTGSGGMVLTSNKQLADRIGDMLDDDKQKDWSLAWNYTMSDINASMGIAQLPYLNEFVEKRKNIATQYRELCDKYNISYQIPSAFTNPNYYRFIIRLNKEIVGRMRDKLRSVGIFAEPPVNKPISHFLNLDKKDFPNTEKIHSTALSLPIYPSLSEEEIKYVIGNLEKLFLGI